jgi:photosystem II stability/assembly factor-like uncharacterized protein
MRVDGAFHDWDGMLKTDDTMEQSTNGNRNVDIDRFSATKNDDKAFFFVSVEGEALAGSIVPEGPRRYVPPSSPYSPDNDRDRVPDEHDRIGDIDFSRDFNNDGVPDTLESRDIDGDGVYDHPYGFDVWLNTTIPHGFPEPYAGTQVSLFIGIVEKPPVRGEDIVRVFIDTDQCVDTGYSHQGLGADYLVDVRGRDGAIRESILSSHSGNPGTWKWEPLGDIEIAKHWSQIELAVEKQRLGLDNGQSFDVSFQVADWNLGSHDGSEGVLSEVSEDPFALEAGGGVYQSLDGGSTWSLKGDAGSSSRAIVANYSNYVFVLKKSGDIYGSGDAGSTWTLLGDVGAAQDFVDLEVDDSDYLYALRAGGDVYQSVDSAQNWNVKGDADPSVTTGFVGIACDSSGHVYALVGNGTVHASTDEGSSWTFQGDAGTDTDYVDITADDGDYLYTITTSGYVNESQDSGSSWSYRSDVGSEIYTAIEWGNDSYLYVLATTGEVYRSSDGGSTWDYRGDVGTQTDHNDLTAMIPEFETLAIPLLASLIAPFYLICRKRKSHRRD